jgi:cytoskeleton protein RodZ
MSDIPKNLAQLRQDRGMSIEALAASIKVSPAKLQALEAGRYEELANAAYVRALAMAVCRALKADPRYILAALPAPDHHSILSEVPEQQPFRAGRARLNLDSSVVREVRQLLRPKFLVPLFILAAAIAVYNWPVSPPDAPFMAEAPASAPVATSPPAVKAPATDYSFDQAALAAAKAAAEAASTPVSGPDAAPMQMPSASDVVSPPLASASVAPTPVASAPAGTGHLVLLANAESWIQIKDAGGEQLLKRLVLAGERIALQGALPFKIKLGNASAVQLTYQGKPVDLTEHTRANVARFELN